MQEEGLRCVKNSKPARGSVKSVGDREVFLKVEKNAGVVEIRCWLGRGTRRAFYSVLQKQEVKLVVVSKEDDSLACLTFGRSQRIGRARRREGSEIPRRSNDSE